MVQKDRNNKPFYNDHSELTAIWNRLRRGRYGQNSGGGSIGGIEIIGQDGYFDDAWIDPEDESIIVFQKSPITIPSITLDSINQNIPSDRFIYNIEVDPENDHKLLLYTKPVPAGFELQPATTETLGGIKIGTGLEMDSNNKLNVVFPEPISLAGYVNSISGTPQSGYYISNVTKTDSASGSNLQFTYEKLPETDLSNYYTKTESNSKFMIAANFPELRKIETISTGTASGRLTRNSDGTWRFDNNVYLVQNDLKNLIFQKNGTDSITYIPTTGISVNIKDLILNIKDKHTGSLIGAAFHYNPLDGGSLDISIPTHTGDLTDDGLWVLKAGDTMTGPLVIGSASDRENLTVYGTSTFYNSVTTNGLYVPTAAPSTLLNPIPTNTIPFWLGDGEYGSGQGSGGGGGETLTITVSSGAGTTTYSYNGSSAVSVPISIPSTLSQLNGTTELVKLETGLEAAGNSAGFIKRYLDTTTNTYKYQVDTAAYATTTYVDNAVAGATKYKGTYDAQNGTVNGTSSTFTSIAESQGDMYKVSVAGTYLGAKMDVGDSIIFISDVPAGTAPTSADVSFIEADVPVSAGTSILQWNTEVTLATIDGLAIKAKLPTEPTDTKDTTGATQDTDKLYLVGAKEQGTTQNPYKVTYSNSSVYMQNGTLYSNRSAVLTSHGPSYGKITPGSTSNATTAPSSPSKTQIVAPTPNSNFNIVPLNKWIDVASSASNNEQAINLWHALSSVSGSATGNGTATNGLSFSIPYVGWDAAGHVTSWGNRTHSITGAQIATALNNQTVTNLTITNLTVPGTLFVPAHVPGSTGEDANATAEFWLADGEYGSVSGSGGGGGEMLTITVSSGSGTTTYNYNGSSAVSVPISIPSSLSQLSGTTELVKIENAAASGNGVLVRNNTNGQWTFDNNYLNAISPTSNTGTARPYISNITKSGHTLSITYSTLPADYQLPSELAAINAAATASSGTTTGYLKRTGTNTWSFVNETYSLSTHNHDSVYVKKTDISTGLNLNSSTGAVTLAKATTSTLGGIIISNALTGSVTLTEAAGTTENRYYGVQVDKDGKAFVNIPWTDTHNSHKVDFTAVAGTANTLTFGETFTAVVSINDTTSSTGTMTANYTTVAFTMPTETTLSLGTTSGEGNVVTGISVSNHQITMTKGITALTANDHKALTLKVGSTTVGNDYTSLVAKEYTITKSHLTGAIDSGGGYYVKKEGDTMTGPLTIAGNSNPARNADLTVLGTATFSGILNVPMHAPGSTGQDATSTSSFWLGPGEYGSSQGSGGGGGETLTISVTNSNGTTTYNYNGSSAVSVPISIPTSLSMLSGTTELQKIEYLAQSGGGFLTRNSSNGTWSWDTDTYNSIKQAIPYIEGPTTDTTAGTWTGTYDGITALEEGLTIIYVPHVAGASTTTLNINGLGAKTCYYSGTSKLTTHYPVGTPILFTYRNNGWTRADYNSNSDVYVRVYRQTTGYDDDYPIILSRTKSPGTAGSNGTYSAVYGLMGDTNQPTINPMTGEMKAVKVTATTLQGSLGWSYLTGKPTTIAGYGITDAKIVNGTITLGSNSITPLTSFTETDPTVPAWAKAANKPSYAFSEITNKPTTLAGYGITDAIPYSEILSTVNSFDNRQLWLHEVSNTFWAAHIRYDVTQTGVSGGLVNCFDGSFASTNIIPAGSTGVITIAGKNGSRMFNSGYPYGYLEIAFYNVNIPESVSVRVYSDYGSRTGWHDIQMTNVSKLNDTALYRGFNGNIYGVTQIEITITAKQENPTWITQISFFQSRGTLDQMAVFNKSIAQTLYHNLTAPKYIVTGGTSSQFLKADGSLDSNTYLTAHAYNYGQIAPGAASSAVTAPTSNTTKLESTSSHEILTITPSNKWIAVGGSNGGSGTDIFYVGHLLSGVTAGTVGTSSATSGNSLAVPYVTYDAAGHITATGTHTHTITNNVTYTGTLVADEIATWNNTTGVLKSSGAKLTDYVPKKEDITYYPYIKKAHGSAWYKVTLPFNGYTSSGNAWLMISMRLRVGSTYGDPIRLTGDIHLNYYFLKNSSNVWTAADVRGFVTGPGTGLPTIKYDLANPGIFYIYVSSLTYNVLAIHELIARDTAQNFDFTTTTIEAIAAADIPAAANQTVPIAGFYMPDTNDVRTQNSVVIESNYGSHFTWAPSTPSGTTSWARDVLEASAGNHTFEIGIKGTGQNHDYAYIGYGGYNSLGKIGLYPDGTMVHGYKTVLKGNSTGASTISSALDAVVIAPMPTRAGVGSYYPGLAFHGLYDHNNSTTYNAAVQAWIGVRCTSTTGSELSALVFATKSGTTNSDRPVERMCILPDGKVGIGTTTPTYGLHHVGTSYFNGEATFPKILNVPMHDPSDTSSTTNASFWLGTGEYGSSQGSGGGGGETLTISVSTGSGTTSYSYNGSSAVSVPLTIPSVLSQLSGTTELVKIQTLAATGTPSGFLKRASGGTWSFDTNTYVTSSGNVASANSVKTVKTSTNADFYPTFVDSSNSSATAESVYTGDILKFNPSSGMLTLAKLNLNREAGTVYGRVGFYKNNYYTWYEYMSNVTAGGCPTGATPPTGTYVTSWARRSLIENSSGYGWIWESSSNTANATPAIQMELSSKTGNLKVTGSITGSSIVKSGGTSSQFLKADGSVDSNTYLTSASLSGYVQKSGDTMTGDLRLSANNLYIGSATTSQCHQQYDATNKCLNFIFD